MVVTERRCGYRGKVTLVSPCGSHVTNVRLPYGRWRCSDDQEIRTPRFDRLLSRGWKVVEDGQTPPKKKPAKKGAPSKPMPGSGAKGGESPGSSSEKEAQAPKEMMGEKGVAKTEKSGPAPRFQERGKRGARRRRGKGKDRLPFIEVRTPRKTGGAVRSPQPLQMDAALFKAAEKSAAMLGELVGRSVLKVKQGIAVDVQRLLMALETGDNPLPPLEAPQERPKVRILVTADCSGSTQAWNGLGQAWAVHLSKLPDVDVTYLLNYNGMFLGLGDEEIAPECARDLIGRIDVVVYLGDGDGYKLCRQYAGWGATVLALDCHCANVEKPRLVRKDMGQSELYWVDRVSAKAPETWEAAIARCLKNP